MSLQHARTVVSEFIRQYNHVRLNSAIGYIPPIDRLEGRQETIFQERKQKLQQARIRRESLATTLHLKNEKIMDFNDSLLTEHSTQTLTQAIETNGTLVVSAALEAGIPVDEIGYRFLGVMETDDDWPDSKAFLKVNFGLKI